MNSKDERMQYRSTAGKRDSLAAELEKDPQLSTAKRHQRAQAFTSSMAYASLERQLVAVQTAKMELETRVREKDLAIERLERDRRWFAEREKEEREEKERDRADHEEEKRKTDTILRNLRNSLSTLREQHADLEDTHATLSRSTTQTIGTYKSQVSTLTRQLSALEEEVTELRQTADARSHTIQDLQEQLDELNSAQDIMIRKGAEEENMAVVREELHRQANYLCTLESTNMKLNAELAVLREKHESVEVLKEERRGLERKVRGLEELRGKVVRLEAEVEAGRVEREEWAKNLTEPSTPSRTPVSITQSLSALRLAHARLLEDHGANVALLHCREVEAAATKEQEVEARELVEKLNEEIRVLKQKLARMESRINLADREVGSLQALVASFTAEEAAQEISNFNEGQSVRIRDLEFLVKEYKETIDTMRGAVERLEVDSLSSKGLTRTELAQAIETEHAATLDAKKALEHAEAESEKQLEQIEKLEQTLFELSGEIGAGRHVPPGIRVLSLRDNPDQQWVDLRQAVMDQLKSENEALLKRLKELEESGAVANDTDAISSRGEELVPRESWELVNKEKRDLEDVVKQKEKRLLRLQQVFQTKSTEFREAIASILGVKLAFYPNGQIRVTSIYDLYASFVFQPASKGEGTSVKMQLVAQGEGGPQDLPQMMRYWIEEKQCIPGFLASVTLECYESSKGHVASSV